MRLYGKDKTAAALVGAARCGRLSHALLFSGKRGAGKKTVSRFAAQLFLCEGGNGENFPCGECAACRNIENDNHADVIFVKKACGGKYSIGPLREVLASCATLPAAGEAKVYIFEEADEMTAQYLNTLLKIVEEPPKHLRFIFTCENTALIPETILSRVTEFPVGTAEIEECEDFLTDNGTDARQARELAEMFSGNIGECVEALSDGEQRKFCEAAGKIARALAKKNGYAALCEFAAFSARGDFFSVLGYLIEIFRDAAAEKNGEAAEYFDKDAAKLLAGAFSEEEIAGMCSCAFELCGNEALNLNAALCASRFVSEAL